MSFTIVVDLLARWPMHGNRCARRPNANVRTRRTSCAIQLRPCLCRRASTWPWLPAISGCRLRFSGRSTATTALCSRARSPKLRPRNRRTERERDRSGRLAKGQFCGVRALPLFVEDHLLHHRIERAHGFIVGDVLLRLRRHQVGELQVGRGVQAGLGCGWRFVTHALCHSPESRG